MFRFVSSRPFNSKRITKLVSSFSILKFFFNLIQIDKYRQDNRY